MKRFELKYLIWTVAFQRTLSAHAKENVKDAISLFLEDVREEGKTIPQPSVLQAELVAV